MGFFSFLKPLVKAALPVVAGIVGGEALTTAIAPESKAEAQAVAAVSPVTAQIGQLAGVAAAKQVALGIAAAPDVTGRLRKRTIVQTVDPRTGRVVSQKITAGGVAVFAADAAAAKRFFRQVRKLDARLPRKTQKTSQQKMLTDRLINNALERAGDEPCPK